MAGGWAGARAPAPRRRALSLLLCALAAATLPAPGTPLRLLPRAWQLQQPPYVLAPGGPPVLGNYSFESALDTFELCRRQSRGANVPWQRLLPALRLPKDLAQRKHVTLAQLVALLHDVQPEARVVYSPMLSGEADVARLLEPPPGAGGAGGSDGGPALPRLVHFTVKDKNRLLPHQVVSMASWAFHNPGFSLMLFDDADVRGFMATYYPALTPTFDGLGSQVERTDLWRYLVLCRLGGVYADSDVLAARPVASWAADAGLLVGIENVFATPEEAKERSYARQIQMVQWAIAARPGHPVVCRMGAYVSAHVAAEAAGAFLDPDHDHAILERTGPGIWSSSVHDYVREVGGVGIEQLVAGGLVGDVRVLPQPVLGCASSSYNPSDALPYVYHMFKGSWRSAQPLGAALRKLLQGLAPRDARSAASASLAAARQQAAAAQLLQAQQQQQQQQQQPGGGAGVQRPHLPVLDEAILARQEQRRLAQAQLTAVAAAGRQQQGQPHRQLVRLPSSDAGGSNSSDPSASRQLLLVHGVDSAAAGRLLAEPELPSLRALGGLPALSLLVLAVLLAAVYKQQGGSCSSLLRRPEGKPSGARSAALALGSPSRAAGPLSRPGSRMTLAGSGGSAVAALLTPSAPAAAAAAAAAALAAAGAGAGRLERQAAALHPDPGAVCYASSQHHGNPHRHKRSWGSAANFAHL